MFGSRAARAAEEGQKDIFAPVSDLMVGVVFIFIILTLALSLNLSDEKTVPRSAYDAKVSEVADLTRQLAALQAERAELASENVDLRRDNAALTADKARLVDFVGFVRDSRVLPLMQQLSNADSTRNIILTDMQTLLKAFGIEVRINPDAGTLSLPSSRLSATGQAEPIVRDGRDTILGLGRVMSEVLPCYASGAGVQAGCPPRSDFSDLSAVYIEGHTDISPYGSPNGRFRNNWDLSAGRAIEAYTLMRGHYEVLRTLKSQDDEAIFGVSGYADTRPALREAGDRLQRSVDERDRRIEVRVIMTANERLVGSILAELNQRLERLYGLVE
jgi:hypothetical protein